MPKVSVLKASHGGAEFTATLSVDSRGVFKVKRPGTPEDWNGSLEVSGTVMDDVVTAWKSAVRDYANKATTTRKVIMVKFDSNVRDGGKRCFFSTDATLNLHAQICLETSVTQGEKTTVTYAEHPDVGDMHANNRIPWPMQIRNVRSYSAHHGDDGPGVSVSGVAE